LWVIASSLPSRIFSSGVLCRKLPTYSGRTVQDLHLVPSYPLRWAKELELKNINLYYIISTPVPEFLLSYFFYYKLTPDFTKPQSKNLYIMYS
jgi:hypothetical protein